MILLKLYVIIAICTFVGIAISRKRVGLNTFVASILWPYTLGFNFLGLRK